MIYKKNAEDVAGAARSVTMELLKEGIPSGPVVIKPNIIEPRLPPVTTDVNMVVAEGSGTGDTIENFQGLRYGSLGVRLIDLDREKTVTLSAGKYRTWPEVIVPEMLVGAFIISVPVLKEHSMCGVTVSLKNMVGILPAKNYSGYWSYKKSEIHRENPHGCIADICRIMKPDWAVVDASIGMKGSHISGIPIDPPVNLVYGSKDPLEADIFGCKLLGLDWEDIEYLKMIADDSASQQ
jgi:uncharacterized protein (DUF362 family)